MRYFMIVTALVVCAGCNKTPPPKKPAPKPLGEAVEVKVDQKGVIGKVTGELVDIQAVIDDPNIRRLGDRKIPIADPITQSASAYFIMSAQVSSFGLQKAIQLYQAEHARFPTYEELKKMMKENGVQMAKLRPYEMYGYDQKTGEIEILEDKKKKAKTYEGLGLEEE